MKAAACIPTFLACAAFHFQLVPRELVKHRPLPIDPPKLDHSRLLRRMLPLLSELIHHLLISCVPNGNFQNHWNSAERGHAAMFGTEVALLASDLNCWHFPAKKADIR
jgi:hypothetical protein